MQNSDENTTYSVLKFSLHFLINWAYKNVMSEVMLKFPFSWIIQVGSFYRYLHFLLGPLVLFTGQ